MDVDRPRKFGLHIRQNLDYILDYILENLDYILDMQNNKELYHTTIMFPSKQKESHSDF